MTTLGATLLNLQTNMNMYRNRIINGDMRIDQRNNGATVANVGNWQYLVNQWQMRTAINGINATRVTLSRINDFPPWDAGFRYAFKYTVPNGIACTLQQRIELVNCSDMIFSQKTVSFWIKASSAQNLIVQQRLVPSGDATATTDGTEYMNAAAGDATFSVPTSWTYMSYTFPAMTPTDISVANENKMGMRLAFTCTPTTSTTFTITGVQLEKGKSASPFEFRPFDVELRTCARYYQYGSYALAGTSPSGGYHGGTVYLPVRMRAAPNVSTSAYDEANCFHGSFDYGVSGTYDQFYVRPNIRGAGLWTYGVGWTASAEL